MERMSQRTQRYLEVIRDYMRDDDPAAWEDLELRSESIDRMEKMLDAVDRQFIEALEYYFTH